MKSKIYLFLFIFLATTLFAGCKKYSDGPTISLRTKKERVTGQWRIRYFEVNGVDSTLQISDYCYLFLGPDHSEPGTWILGCGSGFWGFANKKNDIYMNKRYSNGKPLDFIDLDSLYFQIQRLTNDDMWLKSKNLNKEYYIKLYKTKDW